MGGIVETRPRSDLDDPDDGAIARALGPHWRLKFTALVAAALVATLLLIWLAKRGVRWYRNRKRAPQPQPPPPPMCTVCLDDVEQGKERAVTLPCGHPYHRHCIAQVVDNDPRCPVCRASVSPADRV
ncbi:unnamed protein product [Urochloa decumbens]|uniref:RING-type domain-containing protein n=1 Tax=Urochloa decumbens TaxID=240449 RepID=A0ABC9EB34_9POAL